MQFESLAQQCQTEHAALENLKDALRVTLAWKAPSVGMPRKVESVAFIIRALQRHLERQLSLEEADGYLGEVDELKPSLTQKAARLRSEHDAFRSQLQELLPAVEALTADQHEQFADLCAEIDDLLQRIEQHELEETDLLQEALLTDVGGEG